MTTVRDTEIKRLRDLELLIQEIPNYEKPKLKLEQYVTDANIAAVMLWDAHMRGYIRGQRVLDLGCGTGRFAIPAAILGARHVLCIDIDPEAMAVVKKEIEKRKLTNIDLVITDIRTLNLRGKFHVAFQNPPFGIWEGKGTDMAFLQKALEHSTVVYTIHKLSTMDHVINTVNQWGYTTEVLDKAVITIPPMYKHHRKKKHKVEVFIARITPRNKELKSH
ncbi:METTL5 family protein [Vulcanisaeta thermophila]|uniref:METTL5 family protein n=1 Tax=Vulcanisaeta thermophila TaxID=867917 RepID=UPI0008530A1D|nr:METTL5 family protein [Vulcanisaeta thermophila]